MHSFSSLIIEVFQNKEIRTLNFIIPLNFKLLGSYNYNIDAKVLEQSECISFSFIDL